MQEVNQVKVAVLQLFLPLCIALEHRPPKTMRKKKRNAQLKKVFAQEYPLKDKINNKSKYSSSMALTHFTFFPGINTPFHLLSKSYRNSRGNTSGTKELHTQIIICK